MGIISLDFDLDKEAAGLPEGVYQFQVMDAEETESQAGNPMVKLKLAVVNDPQYNGRVVFDNLVVTASMARRLAAFASAAGLDFRMGVDPEAMKTKVVWAEVQHEEYGGEMNAKIKRYRTGR
jgi:hypothetical protein